MLPSHYACEEKKRIRNNKDRGPHGLFVLKAMVCGRRVVIAIVPFP